jgi:N-acyl-D-amino-acid deacylase
MSVSGSIDPSTKELDVLITSGLVLDGRGGVIEDAAVGVRKDRLRVLYDVEGVHARRVINASGKIVCPGFIDIHTHSDYFGLIHRQANSRVLSGVTTEVVGNCGYGAFPLSGEVRKRRTDEHAHMHLHIDWDDVDGYFRRQEETDSAVNRAVLVGHGNVRADVVGYVNRPADSDEVRRMCRILEQALAHGAFGLSTGLVYAPGCFADSGEIVQLAAVAAEFETFYASHIRSESDEVLEAVDEFLDVIRRARVRGQLSHVKVAGPRNWRKFDRLRDNLFAARDQEGLAFFADRYPYSASSTDLASTVLPKRMLANSILDMIDILSDPAERRRLSDECRETHEPTELAERLMVIDLKSPEARPFQGMRLDAIGEQMGLDPFEAAIELLLAEGMQCGVTNFCMDADQTREILSWPFVMIGSDASVRDGLGSECPDHPHPRAYGTPAKFLGQYVRDQKLMAWAEGVHRMCAMPADALGLSDRGVLEDGAAADLVIFDPAEIADRATYSAPAVAPAGIDHVFVNGVEVVRNGEHTGGLAGRLLRHGSTN